VGVVGVVAAAAAAAAAAVAAAAVVAVGDPNFTDGELCRKCKQKCRQCFSKTNLARG
jgi:hypothetical protein